MGFLLCRNHYTSKYVKNNKDKRNIEGKLFDAKY